MPGSPRVERAANIRIQHPNLSTEDAMKLAGYSEDEAKDPKKQSNVRQKTHRMTKGRKRSSTDFPNPDMKRSILSIEDGVHSRPPSRQEHGSDVGGEYFPYPIEFDQNRAHGYSKNVASADGQGPYHTPGGVGRPIGELHRAPGSARSEKAARFWLDNPNLSVEHAMKLAGFSDEDVKDTYRQNDIRHTAHLMTVNSTKTKEKKSEVHLSSELRVRLSAIDRKMDEMANRLERTVDIKLQELGTRIDDKFSYVCNQLSMLTGGSYGQSGTDTRYDRQGSAPPQQQQYPYQSGPPTYSSHRQQSPQGYNMPSGQPPAGGNMLQGGMGYTQRPPVQQGRPDFTPRHSMDSTVQL